MNNLANSKFFEIDGREKRDIIRDIRDIARSYVPEWIFDIDDLDAGCVIAKIYADMLEDDINNLNMLMYKYRIELMNMIGVDLKRAQPAKCVASFLLWYGEDEGAYVPRQTKLIADGKNSDKIIFETQNSMYVTSSSIANIYATSRVYGKIINIFDNRVDGSQDKMDKSLHKSFYLFDYSSAGEQRNELILGHSYALNLNKNSTLSISFNMKDEGDIDKLKQFCDMKKYEWSYLTASGPVLFNKPELKDNKITLTKNQDSEKIEMDGFSRYYISVKQKDNIDSDMIEINDIKFSSSSDNISPDIVYQGDSQVDVNEFYPFGDRLAVYNECYISSDDVFSKKNSEIKISFNLSYIKTVIEIDSNNNIDYKIIMMKPKQGTYNMSESKADEVIFEYFNGVGWAKLNLDNNYNGLFSGDFSGETVLTFVCPDDIEPIAVNAYMKYWIRIRLLKADNSYRVPCYHTVPMISNLRLSYQYLDDGVAPQNILRYSGVNKDDISDQIKNNENVIIFKPIDYDQNSLFIGFDKKFCNGPINIYFDIEGGIKKDVDNIRLEYSCMDEKIGFKNLKVVDETENFRHAGSIIFVPPYDMEKRELFEKERYWIRLVDETNSFENLQCLKINDIILNTVSIENVETKSPESFYIDRAIPNMRFHLSSNNILSANVFVNEITDLSMQQMEDFIKERPDDIIVEHDNLGRYISFFVRWNEVNTFIKSGPNDRHYILNRSEGYITFGDSIRGKIPSKQVKEAIRVFVVDCNGDNGNINVGGINKTSSTIKFISGVKNPIPAYTGHDIETIGRALNRGSHILGSYNRLVSESDFENAVLDFSDIIDKVKCVSSIDEYGKKSPGSITIAVLIKEFEKNSGVFYSTKNEIKRYLMEKCEVSLKENDLNIIDPIFVELCVDVWVSVSDYNMSFEVKEDILKYLKLFIDPVSGNFHKRGWEIGELPKEIQIYSFIKSKELDAIINKIIITGKIKNINGIVERELSEMENNPFIIGVNGTHNVFVNFNG